MGCLTWKLAGTSSQFALYCYGYFFGFLSLQSSHDFCFALCYDSSIMSITLTNKSDTICTMSTYCVFAFESVVCL